MNDDEEQYIPDYKFEDAYEKLKAWEEHRTIQRTHMANVFRVKYPELEAYTDEDAIALGEALDKIKAHDKR
jgi:hypothetical protein